MLIDGILPVYKKLNLRSTDCVQRVKQLLPNGIKIGHAGTLDSTAEGILILLIGRATRLADLIMSMPKIYRVVVNFGIQTSTDDITGDVIDKKAIDHLTDELILEALPSFVGVRSQIPPNISAVHVAGKRAYNLARSGENFQIAPKNVQIIRIDCTKKLSNDTAEFIIECTKGTYIRSFARDLGLRLGTVAHVGTLERVSVWKFDKAAAISSSVLDNITFKSLQNYILQPRVLEGFLPTYGVDASGEETIKNGRELPILTTTLRHIGQSDVKNKILIIGENLLSLCQVKLANNTIFASPKCNICL